jgi:hypothetical protein
MFSDEYSELSCQVEHLQPIVRAFIRNMNRVKGLGLFPIIAVGTATISEAARVQALVNFGIEIHDPRITKGDPCFDLDLYCQIDAERVRLCSEWGYDNTRFLSIGAAGLNQIIDWNPEGFSEAVQTAMAAMWIGLWTTFESLAQDTWLVAVNTHPRPLADRILKTLDKEDQQKFVSGKMVSDAGYDLRNCMGDILLRKGAVDFQRLKGIRLAYKVAFDGELEPIFEQYHPELFELEGVRNLFVHKGGLVDRKFAERMGGEMRDKIGRPILVEGQEVAQKANIVSGCSMKLIQALDKWLYKNPETAPTET